MPTRRPRFADIGEEIRSFGDAPFCRLDVQVVAEDQAFIELVDQLWGEYFDSRKGGVGKRQLSLLIANLYRCWWDDPEAFVALPMSNRPKAYRAKINDQPNRYNPSEITGLIITQVNGLSDAGLIDNRRGGLHPDTHERLLTRIRPDLDLVAMFEALPVSARQSITLHQNAEFIILRDADKNDINYTDTDEIRAMRRRLIDYNLLLDRTFIDIPGLGHPAVIVTPNKVRPRGRQTYRRVTVSQSSKRVSRIFSNSDWDQGGRFWRGFWMSLKSEERQRLHINDEPTVELDYAGLHPVLLYAEAGVDYWAGSDRRPYETIEVFDGDTGELIGPDIIKVFLLIMLNAKDRASGFKAVRKSLGGRTGDIRLTDNLLDRLLEAIRQRHPIVGDQLGTGVGNRLMNTDGRITDIIIDQFTQMDIPVLTIHDSYIVARQHEDLLRQTMVSAYQQVTGAKQVVIDRKEEGKEEVATDEYRKRHQRFLEALGGLTGTDSD